MAVNAAAFIPPTVPTRINLHRQNVFPAELHRVRDVKTETRIAAKLAADFPAIEPVAAVAEHAIKFKPEPFALGGGGNGNGLAIPRRLRRQRTVQGIPSGPGALDHKRVGRIKRAFDHIIMRHIHAPPIMIVVGRIDGIGDVAGMKPPVGVERNNFARNFRQSGFNKAQAASQSQ